MNKMKNIKVLYEENDGFLNVITTKINMDDMEDIRFFYMNNLGVEKISVVEIKNNARYPHDTIEYLILNGFKVKGWINAYHILKDDTFNFFVNSRKVGIILGHVINHTESIISMHDETRGLYRSLFRLFRHLENYSNIVINTDICNIYDRYDLENFRLVEKTPYCRVYEGVSPNGIDWKIKTMSSCLGKKKMISLEKEKKMERTQTYVDYIKV